MILKMGKKEAKWRAEHQATSLAVTTLKTNLKTVACSKVWKTLSHKEENFPF